MPIVLFLVLMVAEFGLFEIASHYSRASIGWPISLDRIPLILIEMTGLFFLARFNKIMAAATLFTATISTAYVIYNVVTQPSFAPP
jgi:hypothetical protein